MAFSESKRVQSGKDDIRAIDWNVTAWFGHPTWKFFWRRTWADSDATSVDVSGSENLERKLSLKRSCNRTLCSFIFSAIQTMTRSGLSFSVIQLKNSFLPKRSHPFVSYVNWLSLNRKNSKTNISEGLRYLTNVIKKRSICFVILILLIRPLKMHWNWAIKNTML